VDDLLADMRAQDTRPPALASDGSFDTGAGYGERGAMSNRMKIPLLETAGGEK
jgi:hypothetical protein